MGKKRDSRATTSKSERERASERQEETFEPDTEEENTKGGSDRPRFFLVFCFSTGFFFFLFSSFHSYHFISYGFSVCEYEDSLLGCRLRWRAYDGHDRLQV